MSADTHLRRLRSRYEGPVFGPVGFAGAIGVGLFVEMVVLLGLPYELISLSIIPAVLMLSPWLRVRQIAVGVLVGWLTVPLGIVVAPIQAIVGLIGGIRLIGKVVARRYDVPGGEPEVPRTDAWVAGVLWMPLALTVSLLATWKISDGLTPAVPGRGELAADGKAFLIAGAGVALAGLFAVFGRRPRTFGSAHRLVRGRIRDGDPLGAADDLCHRLVAGSDSRPEGHR
ncbi:hypothetical protein [Nocardia sp. NPDC056000]|uniref:hypothetical protein n=1 Tax=Nocardia sp. NPDC056000 TaxID=3345674 RepID=UPI0035DF29A5